jgi:hypothetical protein
MTEKSKNQPPLKAKILRRPGQSLQREMDRLLEDRLLPVVMFTAMMGMATVSEWLRWFSNSPPHPYFFTVLTLPMIVYSVYLYVSMRKRLERLCLGRDGERVVGQLLNDLRGQGCLVFHDLLGDGFNIDHVVLSPHGLFMIETKTYSKPAHGTPEAHYDGEHLLINGREHDRSAVQQVQALRRWLQEQLLETTGKRFPVRGVVLLPEWFVRWTSKEKSEVWVLNPKQLAGFVAHEPVSIAPEDVALIASRIARLLQPTD